MRLKLKSLTLENFKGIKSLNIEFNDGETRIRGDNATGKTSIFDAFTWLLFNKDSSGKQNFEVRTWNGQNEIINRINHSVEAVFYIDDAENTVKKVLKERWVKRRGSREETFEGCENNYFWNDVPQKEREFNERVKSVVDEGLFKILTNPLFFNSLNWKDRREYLFEIAGNVSDAEIIAVNSNLRELSSILERKSIDELKKEIAFKKKKYKKELEEFKPRIDEVYKSKVEVGLEKVFIESELEKIKSFETDAKNRALEVTKHNDGITNAILEKQTKLNMAQIVFESDYHSSRLGLDETRRELELEISETQSRIEALNSKIHRASRKLDEKSKFLLDLRAEAVKIKAREFEFDETESLCPTCGRKFEESVLDEKRRELKENFNRHKVAEYENVKADGLSAKKESEELAAEILNANSERANLKDVLNKLNSNLESVNRNKIEKPDFTATNTYKEITAAITELKNSFKSSDAEEISNISKRRDELNSTLAKILNNERADARIKELTEEEKKTSQAMSQLEKYEYLSDEFIKAKIGLTEQKINSLFQITKFKLFKYLNNGGTEECCEAIHNGVEQGNLNSSARINVGLDIINALIKFHGVSAPIFIDNRESVVEILGVDAQIINLIVDERYKTLFVEEFKELREAV